MKDIVINTEFIKLGQLLKLTGDVSSGAEAKMLILEEHIKVNDIIETRRGRKIYNDYTIQIDNFEKYIVKVETI